MFPEGIVTEQSHLARVRTMEETDKTRSCEVFLRNLGIAPCRVIQRGDMVRLQVSTEHVARMVEPAIRDRIVQELKTLGFTYIALDLDDASTLPTPAAATPLAGKPQS
ncbi:MAG TPA: hypothetical protein VGB25_04825 [Candidatus Binatia bacterium]